MKTRFTLSKCSVALLVFFVFAGCAGMRPAATQEPSPSVTALERRMEKSGLDIDLDGNDKVDGAFGGLNTGYITGVVKGSGSAYGAATYLDMVGLWGSGSCTGYLKSDGTCDGGGSGSYADDVDTMLASANNAAIRTNIGIPVAVRTEIGTAWSAAPTGADLIVGYTYWADNDNWDPCSVSGTDNYQTFWNGSSWVCTQDINGNLFIDSIYEDVPIADSDGTGSFKFAFDFSELRSGTLPTDGDFTFAIVDNTTDNTWGFLQTFSGGIAAGNGSTGAGFIRLKEDSDNGTDYSTITGAADAGSYPAFTFGGSQGGEDLTLTASNNTWTFSSSTGVTSVSLGSIGFVTTGTISGGMPSTTDSDGMTISTAEGYGYIHWATGAGTWTLPSAAAGMNLCVYSTTAAAVSVDAATGDQIKPTTNSTGDKITNDSTAGSFVCLVAADATDWHVLGMRGTWTDTN